MTNPAHSWQSQTSLAPARTILPQLRTLVGARPENHLHLFVRGVRGLWLESLEQKHRLLEPSSMPSPQGVGGMGDSQFGAGSVTIY